MKMKALLSLLLMSFSFACLAQEDVVEVGKHAKVNLDAVSMITSLLAVLLLIVISAWVLKKFNLTNQSVAGMKVIASLSLGTKEKLVVVQVADEQLLLAISQQQVSFIKTLDKPLEVSAASTAELNQTLSRFLKKINRR